MRRFTTQKAPILKAFFFIAVIIGLAACGQKGPLVLQNKGTPSTANAEKTPEASNTNEANKK
ncbi:MAG: lipoprotein [Burkholderiaceae bacterium]|nr:lipoprotein [Burkholderiaceae bacterium]